MAISSSSATASGHVVVPQTRDKRSSSGATQPTAAVTAANDSTQRDDDIPHDLSSSSSSSSPSTAFTPSRSVDTSNERSARCTADVDEVLDASSNNDHLFAFASQTPYQTTPPMDPKVLPVITSDDGSRRFAQRICVCLRPNWLVFMRNHCTMQEFYGSMGNISAFLPLLTALAMGRVQHEPQIEFGPALFFTGVYTLALVFFFNVPMPLQPMKYVAAIAIAEETSRQEIVAAGITTGLVVLVLGATNAIAPIAKRIPMCIVRGTQLGLGIGMMMHGLKAACVPSMHFAHTNSTSPGSHQPSPHQQTYHVIQTSEIVWFGADSVVISLVLGIVCVVCMKNHRLPIAVMVFAFGIVLAMIHFYRLRAEYGWDPLHFGPDFIVPVVPSLRDFETAFNKLVVPQLPVTLLNSVVGFEKLATDLFPKHHHPASLRRLCFSIGFGNLLFCWFGMLPVCHGASGLASQYAAGARSSMSMVFLGTLKIMFALLFGSSFVVLLQNGLFPASVLGIMLVTSGFSLASVGIRIDTTNDRDVLLLLLTASATLGLNTGAGFYIGMGAHLLLRMLAKCFPTL